MIVLDLRDKRPIYEQVVEKISQLIVCGVMTEGSKMPSVRNLAIDLSVNPNTIQRAYAQLEQDGYIYTVTGRGNFVAGENSWKHGRLDSARTQLKEALTEAHQTGISLEDVEAMIHKIWGDAAENPDIKAADNSEINEADKSGRTAEGGTAHD